MTIVGADGCKAGWFYFELEGKAVLRHGVAPSIIDLLEACPDADRILMDVPIGLRDEPPSPRECDTAARRLLSPLRHTSVFPVPSRPAVYASGYGLASELNRQIVGKGLPKQSWGIVPKIREADLVLRASRTARRRVRECHPEVCFWALAGGRPMVGSKKTQAGVRERVKVLEAHLPAAGKVLRAAWREAGADKVAFDDVLDALAVAVSGRVTRLQTLPERPPKDRCGLRMEMVFGPVAG